MKFRGMFSRKINFIYNKATTYCLIFIPFYTALRLTLQHYIVLLIVIIFVNSIL